MVTIENGPEAIEGRSVFLHAKKQDLGSKVVFYGRNILLEGDDAKTMVEGEKITPCSGVIAPSVRLPKMPKVKFILLVRLMKLIKTLKKLRRLLGSSMTLTPSWRSRSKSMLTSSPSPRSKLMMIQLKSSTRTPNPLKSPMLKDVFVRFKRDITSNSNAEVSSFVIKLLLRTKEWLSTSSLMEVPAV